MTDSNCRRWMALSDRRATGEALSESERLWCEQHAKSCRECGNEARFWSSLGDVLEKPELLEATFLPVNASTKPLRQRRSWPLSRRAAWFSSIAAGVMLLTIGVAWVRSRSNANLAAKRVAPAAMRFVSVAGEVRVGERTVRAGDPLGTNERLHTRHGRACFSMDRRIMACLDSESVASWSMEEQGLVSVRLERGRLLSRLEQRAHDQRYVVVTGKASVVAKGTEFVVGVDEARRVTVHLHQGHLEVLALSHQNREIKAPSAIVIEDHIATEEWSERVLEADRELLGLGRLPLQGDPTELDVVTRPAGATVMVDEILLGPTPTTASIRAGHRLSVAMPGYATVTELLPTQPGSRLQRSYELTPLPTTGSGESKDAAEPSLESSNAAARSKAAPANATTPRGLLEKAQSLRARGMLRECVGVYRQLVGTFPTSDEARVSLVSLGELELSVLGQPAQALRSFDAYLKQPGPLTREARFGRIRALQLLSRKAEEQAARAAFVRDYPNSVQAERLRRVPDPR